MKSVPYLEPGAAVYAADLEAWEKYAGLKIGSGDALFLRTGRWVLRAAKGPWNVAANAAGFHASVMPWLKQRDVALLGNDGVNDVQPSGVEGSPRPDSPARDRRAGPAARRRDGSRGRRRNRGAAEALGIPRHGIRRPRPRRDGLPAEPNRDVLSGNHEGTKGHEDHEEKQPQSTLSARRPAGVAGPACDEKIVENANELPPRRCVFDDFFVAWPASRARRARRRFPIGPQRDTHFLCVLCVLCG